MGQINTPGSANYDDKKLLKQQTVNLSQQYWKGRSIDKLPSLGKKEIINEERDEIANILLQGNEFLKQRAIVFDINNTSDTNGKNNTEISCKYGLSGTINNLNSFIDFCAIHGLIPMIDKITINQQDISQIKEVYSLFSFALINKDPLIANIIFNEIKKIEQNLKEGSKDILEYLMKISYYTGHTFQQLFGQKLEKTKNTGTFSENIFSEVALRLENQIREKLGIMSSYLKLASLDEDTQEKTDMHFVLKKQLKDEYRDIPVQFTISGSKGDKVFGLGSKSRKIEDYLCAQGNTSKLSSNNFIILSVNGDFKDKIAGYDKDINLTDLYGNWLRNPSQREKGIPGKFPLFIDQIGDIGESADVMYIALHMLYKKYNFRKSELPKYINTFTTGEINEYNGASIKTIQLADIYISDFELSKIDPGNRRGDWILKHEFNIGYKDLPMGKIIIYAK